MKIVFFLLAFITSVATFAQSDYRMYHYNLNKVVSSTPLDSTIYFYETAFKYAVPFSEDAIRLGMEYIKKNDFENSEKWMKRAIELGYQFKKDEINKDEVDYIMTWIPRDTTSLVVKFVTKYMNQHYDSLRQIYISQCSKEDLFEQLLDNENYVQSLRNLFWSGKVVDSIAYQNICKYGFTPNGLLFLKMLENRTFPKRRETRRFNNHSITMLLNHCIAGLPTKQEAERFLVLLWKLVEVGEIKPREYEQAYDQYIEIHVEPQKSYFGSRTISENGKRSSIPLIDPKNVEKYRAEAWLQPLTVFNKYLNIELPPNYEK